MRRWLASLRQWMLHLLDAPQPRDAEHERWLESYVVQLQTQRAETADRVRALEDVVRRARPAIGHLAGPRQTSPRLLELLHHMDQLVPPAPPLDDTSPPQRVRYPDHERVGYVMPEQGLVEKVALYDSDPERHSELLTADEAQRALIGDRAWRRKKGLD